MIVGASRAVDSQVGRIAGAIYSDLTSVYPDTPLMLVPALTFKVRRILEDAGDIHALTVERKKALAHDMLVSIVPLLFSLDVDAGVIERAGPVIELAALRAMLGPTDDRRRI